MAYLALIVARPDELDLDLHGYRYASGERVARTKIAEAYANGFRSLRIIHGSSTGGSDNFAPHTGTLKAAILALVQERAIARILDRDPFIGDTATVLFFKRNHHPSNPVRWTALPRPEYTQQSQPPLGAAQPGEQPIFRPPPT